MKPKPTLLTLAGIVGTFLNACAAPTITIHADQPGAKINPAMWGVFF